MTINWIEISDILKVLLALLIIAVASHRIAGLFAKIKLPLITGFIIIGVLAGRYILKMLPENLDDVKFIEDISLGFIAFAAGTELYLKEIRDRIKSISIMTASQFVLTFVISFFLLLWLSPYIPMLNTDRNTQIAIALLIATIFIARSPASAIAIINELRAKGPYTKTAIGVTVVKDILVMILFTVTFGFAESLIKGVKIDTLQFLSIFLGLFLTIGIGLVYGLILKLLFKQNFSFTLEITIFLLLGWSVFGVSRILTEFTEHLIHHTLHLEPLLAGVVAGFYITNYTKYRVNIQKLIEKAGNHVYVVFFTFIGATLELDKLNTALGVVLLLFAIRLFAIIIASIVGSILIKDNWKLTLLSWTPYITQAGVSIGLIAVVASNFESFGADFETILISVIIINQFVGPPLMKWAILQAGEAHVKADHTFDGVRDVFILGLEGKSIALAKSLKRRGWNVKIITDRKEVDKDSCSSAKIEQISEWNYENLEKLGMRAADAAVILQPEDLALKICEILYEHFGIPNVVVRIDDRSYLKKLRELGAIVVEPASAMVNLLEHFVVSPQATTLLLGMEEGQETMDIEVLNTDVHGMALRDLRLPLGVLVLYINRNGLKMLSHGYTRLRLHDIVTVVGSPEQLEKVRIKLQYNINA